MAKATTITELRQNPAGLRIMEVLKILKIELKDNYSIKQIAHIAICVNNLPLLRSIYQHCDKGEINAFDEQKTTMLHTAVVKRCPAICLFLIKKQKVDIKAQDKNGVTALHYAIIQNMQRIVIVLINQGAETNILTHKFNSCLHLAVEHSSRKLVKKFIEEGNDVNGKNISGLTPLHLASANGNAELAKLLLDNGAEIESLDINNDTPLFIAAINEHYKTLDFLIKNKANIYHLNKQEQNVLHKMSGNYYPDIEIIEFLIEQNIDIRSKDKNGLTPLHLAALSSKCESFNKLLTLLSKIYYPIELIEVSYPFYQIRALLINGDIDEKKLDDLPKRDSYAYELNFAIVKNHLLGRSSLSLPKETIEAVLKNKDLVNVFIHKFKANLLHIINSSELNLNNEINKISAIFKKLIKSITISEDEILYEPLSLKALTTIAIIKKNQHESVKRVDSLPLECVEEINNLVLFMKNHATNSITAQEIYQYCHVHDLINLHQNLMGDIIEAEASY